jgi:Flp pilus assembly pilin Flp
MNRIWNFIKDEGGLESVEYAVIAGLILLGVVVTIGLIGGDLVTIYGNLKSNTAQAAAS